MKKVLFNLIAALIALNTFAQTGIFKNKRTYKVEGYIVLETDTIFGTIAIPITYDELDYKSLAVSLTFTDSLKETKKYTPRTATAFGLRGDAVLGDYLSIRVEDLGKVLFLKKVLEGNVTLFEHKLDKVIMKKDPFSTSPIGKKESIDESVYYVRKGSEPLIKIEFNSKTSTIRKKDLKKLMSFLPENFIESDEEISESELINLLSMFNAKAPKE